MRHFRVSIHKKLSDKKLVFTWGQTPVIVPSRDCKLAFDTSSMHTPPAVIKAIQVCFNRFKSLYTPYLHCRSVTLAVKLCSPHASLAWQVLCTQLNLLVWSARMACPTPELKDLLCHSCLGLLDKRQISLGLKSLAATPSSSCMVKILPSPTCRISMQNYESDKTQRFQRRPMQSKRMVKPMTANMHECFGFSCQTANEHSFHFCHIEEANNTHRRPISNTWEMCM